VTEPPGEIDSWLAADVEPLAPPPGTFGRIRRQARRRKAVRTLVCAAGAVALIAGAVGLPQAARTLLHSSTGRTSSAVAALASPRKASPRPGKSRAAGGATPETHSATIGPLPTSALSAGSSGSVAPAKFQPTSVTFINTQIGAVIGQAGSPGHCASIYCTSLAGTSDYGTSWYGVSAPQAGAPSGAAGVSQVRFLNLSDGWAFGPGLFVTHDGGRHWTAEPTYGLRVTDLETAGGHAFALFASCTGDAAAYGAQCRSFSLFSSIASGDQWLPVSGPAGDLTMSGAGLRHPAAASLLLAGSTGYVLAPSGQLYSGPLTGAAWRPAGQAPGAPGGPGPGGQPTGGLLAAGSGQLFELLTTGTGAGGSQAKLLYGSGDGKRWFAITSPPAGGIARSLAAGQGFVVVLATTAGIDVSHNDGTSWTQTQASPPGAAAGAQGFSYVGMTSRLQGVAVPADPHLHEIFTTNDGGKTWQPRLVES
jgi:hypothetical protein